jgi:hypothetical protein
MCVSFMLLSLSGLNLRRTAQGGIGRMRHAVAPIEMAGQVAIFGKQARGRGTGETFAVANEMSLIVVSAGEGSVDPVAGLFFEDAENFVERCIFEKSLGGRPTQVWKRRSN